MVIDTRLRLTIIMTLIFSLVSFPIFIDFQRKKNYLIDIHEYSN